MPDKDKVSNETLAEMIRGLVLRSDDQERHRDVLHRENIVRFEEIRDEVKVTNGRLRKVESKQIEDFGRFQRFEEGLGRKADASALESLKGGLERLQAEVSRRIGRVPRPRREIVIRLGWAGAGAAVLPLVKLIWMAAKLVAQ